MDLLWWTKKEGIEEHVLEHYLKENPGMLKWMQSHKTLVGDLFQDASLGTFIWAAMAGPSKQTIAAAALLGVVGTVLSKAGLIASDAEATAKQQAAALTPEIKQLAAVLPAAEDIAKLVMAQIQAVAAEAKAAAPLSPPPAVHVHVAAPAPAPPPAPTTADPGSQVKV